MTVSTPDNRSPQRKALDDAIAAEPPLPPPDLPPSTSPTPLESLLKSRSRPFAVAGVVENGLVRPLDPSVRLPEHARVIIVASAAPDS